MNIIKTGLFALAVSLSALSVSASTGGTAGGNYADLIGAGEGGAGPGAWSATNPGSTATGRYQFLFDNFKKYGYITPDSPRPSPGAGEWTNVRWTGKDGVNSRTDFMNNHAAQDSMLSSFTQDNWNAISRNVPLGTTVNGVQMSQAGALYAAHMLGTGGFNQWASCGFQAHCLDAKIARDHGWTVEQYNAHLMGRVAKGGGYDASVIASGSGGSGGLTPPIDSLQMEALMPWKNRT